MFLQKDKRYDILWCGSYQPLLLMKDGGVLLHRNQVIYKYQNGKRIRIATIERRSFFNCIHIINRLLRNEVRCGSAIGDNDYYFFFKRSLYHLEIESGAIKKLYTIPKKDATPLNIVAGGDRYIVLWGEYGNNKDRLPVRVFALNKDNNVETIKVFNNRRIRHIHNIVPHKRGYFIFCGDNEADAGIYWVDSDWGEEVAVMTGTQLARTVIGFSVEDGILYATDSVEEQNYIVLLNFSEDKTVERIITKINGSVIYGAKCKGGFLFSTTVESSEITKGSIWELLSTKRGKGILSDWVELIFVDINLVATTICKMKKDRLPYKLFQYGSIRFPEGLEETDDIIIWPVAVRNHSGKMGIVKKI